MSRHRLLRQYLKSAELADIVEEFLTPIPYYLLNLVDADGLRDKSIYIPAKFGPDRVVKYAETNQNEDIDNDPDTWSLYYDDDLIDPSEFQIIGVAFRHKPNPN